MTNPDHATSRLDCDHWWPATPVSSCWRLAAWNNGGNALAEPDSFLLPQSSNGVADGLSWVTFCPCMVYSKMHYCRKTFISRDKDVFSVETSDKNRAKKVFHQSLWKEPRSWDWLLLWNQKEKIITTGKARLEAFWPNDKSKWSDNNRKVADEKQFSVFLPLSSGNANLTNF